MKLKTLLGLVVVGGFFSSIAFGQTLQIAGTVSDVNDTQITLQSGKDVWTIKRTSTTKVISGDLKAGSTVTVQCLSPDAHKQELPNTPMTSPSSSPG